MNYYNEIKNELINNEINKKVKNYSINKSDLNAYYNVGKMLNEAGKHYGENIIGAYAQKLKAELNKKYNERTLRRYRQFYNFVTNLKWSAMPTKLSWSHITELMILSDEDEINYYINLVNDRNISYRKLSELIKDNEYGRIDEKTKNKLRQKENLTVKDLQEKMQSNKNVLFDKEYVKIKKDTFDTINKVIDDATNVMNLQPKLEKVYKEVDSYTKSYQSLKRENTSYENEIKVLEFNNNKLNKKNTELTNKINGVLKAIKKFFRKLLQFGSEIIKEAAVDEIKEYFDNKIFKKKDVVDISINTTKEDELFDYVDYPRYYGVPKYNELDEDFDKNKDDDFDISM